MAGRSASRAAVTRQPRGRLVKKQSDGVQRYLGKAKVDELDEAPVVENDVLGLEVAV